MMAPVQLMVGRAVMVVANVSRVGPAADPLLARRTGASAATTDHIVTKVSKTYHDEPISVIKLSHA